MGNLDNALAAAIRRYYSFPVSNSISKTFQFSLKRRGFVIVPFEDDVYEEYLNWIQYKQN